MKYAVVIQIGGFVFSISVLFVGVLLVLGALSSGCRQSDPCFEAVDPLVGVGGETGLDVTVLARSAPRDRDTMRLDCVQVAVLSSSDYADTLAFGAASLARSAVRIRELPTSDVDVIIERDGLFPVKLTKLELVSGVTRLDDRFTLYPVDAPVVLPGQLVAQLRVGSTIQDIRPLYTVFEGIEVRPEPGSYHFLLKNEGRRLTQAAGGRLAARLAHSPHVVGVWPVGEFSSVY
jgi:hypothetical protein